MLKLLDISGNLVSIDAMGYQTGIASQIIEQGGDYLLAVKGNEENLSKAEKKALWLKLKQPLTCAIEQGHGRIEAREYHVMSANELVADFPAWTGLKSIGVDMGYRLDSAGNESLDYRYYISSAELTPERLAEDCSNEHSLSRAGTHRRN